MAKGFLSFVGILMLIIFSAGTAIVGAFMMISSLISGNANFLKGLEVFFLGSISFTVTMVAYTATKVLRNTDILAECMADTLDALDRQQGAKSSLMDILGRGGFPPPFPFNGTVRMAKMDKDGNITPVGEREFGSHEEFLKFRDELINNAMNKNGKKPVSEMSLEELENEREAAEKAQNFELAAAIRDAINEKKKKKE